LLQRYNFEKDVRPLEAIDIVASGQTWPGTGISWIGGYMKDYRIAAARALLVCVSGLASLSSASAALLNFDDRPGLNRSLEDGYRGYNWLNMTTTDRRRGDYQGTGYSTGVVSGDIVAYGGSGSISGFSRDNPFDFNRVYLTTVGGTSTVAFSGYIGDALTFSRTVPIGNTPTLVNFYWKGVTNVTFQTISGDNIIFDDLRTRNVSAVPEPSTWAMLIIGFGAVGWSLRRRKRGSTEGVHVAA
jgi:hypothetical protein